MNTTSHGITNYFLLRHRQHAGMAALAGLMPDIPYVLALLWGILRHGPTWDAVITTWANPYMNFVSQRVLQSVVLASALSLVALASKNGKLRAFAAGWSLHVWIDHWLHARDAYPTLWPLSRRVFPSPVSYWDWDYGGRWMGVLLAIWAIALWIWLARRFFRGTAGGSFFAARGRKIAGALSILMAASSIPGIGFAVVGSWPSSRGGAWVDEGFQCWPAPLASAVEKLRAGDHAGSLALLESLPKGADAAPCEGGQDWERPREGARIALLSGYAHDLAGRRDAALWEYRKAESIEPVGSVGDKARRYQGEVFRNEPDPPLRWEWVAIFVWGLALCVVMVRSVPRD